ncbi:MAG: 2-oxoacid:acceptor oxidoreductase family protein [Candidatus Omnitrophica bacterium]|nr:2-oxoacid:acceptor oxidoreductase family protein [Candidatus Omnitrophota bacterium]
MIEIRFHGRGGQGAVVASGILAEAAFREGKDVQSFPFFGVERRGAPVVAFTRIDSKYIRLRQKIYTPDYVLVLDPTLVEKIDVAKGLKKGGSILINTDKNPDAFSFGGEYTVATVNASNIATRLGLGSKSSPIVNTTLLGAFSKFTGIVGIKSVLAAIEGRVPVKRKENMLAARLAYEKVRF